MCAGTDGTMEIGLTRREFLTGALAATGAGMMPAANRPAPGMTAEERETVFLQCVGAMTTRQRQELRDLLRARVRWRRFLAAEVAIFAKVW